MKAGSVDAKGRAPVAWQQSVITIREGILANLPEAGAKSSTGRKSDRQKGKGGQERKR